MEENQGYAADEKEAAGAGLKRKGERLNIRKTLPVVATALLVVVVVGSAFALGYWMGDRSASSGMPEWSRRAGRLVKERRDRLQRAVRRRMETRELLLDEGTGLIKGKVLSVEGERVNVGTVGGNEVLELSDGTVFTGPGASGAAGGAERDGRLSAGSTVMAIVRPGKDGVWDAVEVRVIDDRAGG